VNGGLNEGINGTSRGHPEFKLIDFSGEETQFVLQFVTPSHNSSIAMLESTGFNQVSKRKTRH
jgi:hypothetical protein